MTTKRKAVSNQIRATRKVIRVPNNNSRTDFEREWDAENLKVVIGGLTLKDMPGADLENKKLNWFLFRRGKLEMDEAGGERWNRWGKLRRKKKPQQQADAGEDEP